MSQSKRVGATHEVEDPQPLFEIAQDLDPRSLFHGWLAPNFIEELVDRIETPYGLNQFRTAEVRNHTSEEEGLELLMVAEDGSRVFVGEDTTARDSNGHFGFVIEPGDDLPMVRTTEEALNLLKPAEALAAEMDEKTALRQGEWFLVETDDEPSSPVYSGEVGERPFGASPLENHVPTEWAIGIPEAEFMERFEKMCPELAPHVETPGDAFQRVHQGHEIAEIEGVELQTNLVEVQELRDLAQRVYVRGTLRHRENDHYMESIGDEWHLAVTHDVEVFTIDTDDLTTPIRRD